MLKKILFLLSILSSVAVNAQPIPMFHHFTTVDGLPSSQTYQVLQDRKGYLWFASDHGVTRYNGYEFKTYTTADGLKDNTVFKLQLGLDNKLWMQTASGRLFYIEDDKIKDYRFNSVITELIKSNVPLSFYVDSLEQVNFICSWIGEFKIDTAGILKPVFPYDHFLPFNKVHFHTTDSRKIMTSGNFLANVDKPTWLYHWSDETKIDSVQIAPNYTGQLCVARDRDNRVFVSISKQLFELKDNTLIQMLDFPATVSNLFFDSENELWIGTYTGLYRMENINHPSVFTSYLPRDFVSGMCEDSEGGKWITTVNNGVYYMPDHQIKSYVFDSNVLNEPLCLTHDRNYIYAGLWNGKMVRFTSSEYKVIYETESSNYLSKVYCDSVSDKIYISKSMPGYMLNEKYYPLKLSASGTLKGGYIRRYNGDLLNISVKHIFSLRDDSVKIVCAMERRANCLLEVDKHLLIGTNNGVFRVNESNCELTEYEGFLGDVRIDDMALMGNNVCFATKGKGLVVKYGNELINVTQADGLSSNLIHKLSIYNNTIWCASFNGISKVTFTEGNPKKFIVTNVEIPDGLPDNEINDLLFFNDTIWVATKMGISYFPANADFKNPVPPPVYFTSFKINTKQIDFNHAEAIPYYSNTISIGFEGLSFRSGGKLLYKYLLIHERDSLESSTTGRQVEFLSLKPGKYIFSVTSMNHSGTWSTQPAVFHFTILAPFWQRWWFITLTVIVAALIVFFIMRIRIERVRKAEAMKTDFNRQLAELEMKALRAQMNPHFIFNVMNSIQDYILKNDSRSAQRYLTRFAKLVRLILDNSMTGEIVLSQELKAAELYIELEQQRFDDKFEFKLDVDESVEDDSLLIPSMILQPYLENAIKHGISHLKERGFISVYIIKEENNITISIEDNGVGRKASASYNSKNVRDHVSYGSLITADRIKAYNIANNTSIRTKVTDLIAADGSPAGTQVLLIIPIKFR
ncbi:MAG: histidine kinase [Bacteroidota bacterium]